MAPDALGNTLLSLGPEEAARVAAALLRITSGPLNSKMSMFVQRALDLEQRSPKGRELLFMMSEHYSTDRTQEVMYSITDLLKAKMKGDKF